MATILVVDDTASQLELIDSYLLEAGYTVVKSSDAKDAFEQVVNLKPDAIITDVVMPGMSGFEFCRLLKRTPETKKVPIIICSSKNKDIDRIWGLRQGADVYLTKALYQTGIIKSFGFCRLVGKGSRE
ncbi:MAG: response regulator [Calothrix sp. SM1_7_51]|nr:response regulator [Calothrix sp. SM1_7_51]